MIDFKTNTIYFGYGDVIVANSAVKLYFRGITPFQKVGTHLNQDALHEADCDYVGESVSIYLTSVDEITALEELLKKMNGRDTFCFTLKDWTFNFSI